MESPVTPAVVKSHLTKITEEEFQTRLNALTEKLQLELDGLTDEEIIERMAEVNNLKPAPRVAPKKPFVRPEHLTQRIEGLEGLKAELEAQKVRKNHPAGRGKRNGASK